MTVPVLLLLLGVGLLWVGLVWMGIRFFSGVPVAAISIPRIRWNFWQGRFSRRDMWLLILPVAVLLPLAAILALGGQRVVDPLQVHVDDREAHIRARLHPERLVPPPPLPPQTFEIQDRADLVSANRDWSLLDPGFQQLVLRVMARTAAKGYSFALLEGYRSPERQDALARQGAHVTHARAWQSRHQYGLAVDLAPMKEGTLVISEKDPWAFKAYQVLGAEAEAEGLVWGGRWTLQDYGHLERPTKISQIMSRS